MKRLISLFLLLLLFGMAQGVWAGAEEEVAQAGRQFAKLFNEGNAEAISALYTDEAQLFHPIFPYRFEGKGAIQRRFEDLFRQFPQRRLVIFQPSVRVYGGTTAVFSGYWSLTTTDRKGEVGTSYGRVMVTYVKQGDKWLRAGHHGSLLPVSP